ncbi:MAG: DNA-formamidopyrimidine glycosylase family protein [Acidimicrobiales bacterium]
MPELPELQAHAERLDAAFSGATLSGFRPLTFTALKTAVPAPGDAFGRPLVFVGRRGKYLLFDVESVTFVVHLMQGGRLRLDVKQAAKPRGGIARWSFDDGRALLLTEPGSERKAGVWVVAGDPEGQEPLDHLGPDADQLDGAQWAALLARHPMRLHGLLRDQRIVAGLGRRLANEISHRARLSPFANTAKFDRAQAEQIAEASLACINDSLAEERGRDDLSSSAERNSHVHNRVGQACTVCGDTVRSVEYRAYTVAYCPTCQTAGKILADNTTSKFLK